MKIRTIRSRSSPFRSTRLAPELVSWWTALNDPILNELIVCAVENNRDLRVAAERIFEARARRGTVASSLFPQIDTDASFTHERRPSGGIFGGSIRDWWSWGTNLSWEIDVFGRLRRLLEAADADVGERQELYRDTLILLIAETAATYVEARSHQEQMAIVEANIEVQSETVRLVRSRFDNEKTDMLDVSQSEGSLKGVEAGYPTFRILYRQSINRLSVLTWLPARRGGRDHVDSRNRSLVPPSMWQWESPPNCCAGDRTYAAWNGESPLRLRESARP